LSVRIDQMSSADWPDVRRIYEEGIATGLGTFETAAPSWDEWNGGPGMHRMAGVLHLNR
jgi:L-amino acid N-acyltransferase YncA